jgi:2-hydroxychromene-2-carboxylate isomerase
MAKTLEFFFDFGSGASYLAYSQVPKLAAACGATLKWRPMLLGGVFKATGNSSPVNVPAKGRWMFEDLTRWAKRYDIAFVRNPHFPINTLSLMRGAVGLQMRQPEAFSRYCDAVFRGIWQDSENLGEAQVLGALLQRIGIDVAAFSALVSDPEIKARLIADTDEAVARGAFGAPTMFVGDQMFFGNDRLDFVREALSE